MKMATHRSRRCHNTMSEKETNAKLNSSSFLDIDLEREPIPEFEFLGTEPGSVVSQTVCIYFHLFVKDLSSNAVHYFVF